MVLSINSIEQELFGVPAFKQVAFWKFLTTLFTEQNSVPTNPVKPQSAFEAQFNSEFLHSLANVPGFMHSSFVKGLKSLQSSFLLHFTPLHSPFKQISEHVSIVLLSVPETQELCAVPGLLQV